MVAGSFTSESKSERQEFIDEVKRAMDAASDFGCHRITTCPLNDGTDTLFELDYGKAYDHATECFSEACAHDRGVRVCIEYKESDPGHAAFSEERGDGQLLPAGERGQPRCHLRYRPRPVRRRKACPIRVLLAKAKRLFYVHSMTMTPMGLDMLPGAYHLWEFVELFYYLRELDYQNDWYGFDVFRRRLTRPTRSSRGYPDAETGDDHRPDRPKNHGASWRNVTLQERSRTFTLSFRRGSDERMEILCEQRLLWQRRDRFTEYQPDRTLEEKFLLVKRSKASRESN